jgi:hypothetical protein
LHYEGKMSAEFFGEEEGRLTGLIDAARSEEDRPESEPMQVDDLAARFVDVARLLQELDIDRMWLEVTDAERRVLIDELIEAVIVHPDHLVVAVSGAPPLNVTLEEVGLAVSQISGVGGGT